MKKLIVVCSMILSLLSIVGHAGATVLDFETGSGEYALTSYGGLTWTNMYTYSYAAYNSVYSNTLSGVSGERFGLNGGGASAGLMDGSDFDFNGVYLTGWAQYDASFWGTGNAVTITGYNDGTLVGTYVANLTLGTMTYFNVGMNNVDQLIFTTSGNYYGSGWFVMDDFTYNASAVPEPATLLLLGLGLIGMAGLRKKVK